MRVKNCFVYLLLGFVFLIFSSCQDENGENDFSGVGRLIASRNKARYDAVEKLAPKEQSIDKTNVSKKNTTDNTNALKSESNSRQEKLSSITLYEEKIKILGSKSGRTLANGVAYINKKGEIVKIKILKN
jgi:hypothetical protein